MSLTPEPIHEGVHILHVRMSIAGVRQQIYQLAERGLKMRVVIARLITSAMQPVAKLDHGNLVAQELRQRRIWNIGIAHHHSKADPLLVPARQFEGQLPVLAKIQLSWSPLHIFPIDPQVKLRAERQLDQVSMDCSSVSPSLCAGPTSSQM